MVCDFLCLSNKYQLCLAVVVINQLNGIEVLVKRIEEILQPGQNRQTEDKRQITDILESCISTLRILTKGNNIFLSKLTVFQITKWFPKIMI